MKKKFVGIVLMLAVVMGVFPPFVGRVEAADVPVQRTETGITDFIDNYWKEIGGATTNRYWNNKLGRSFANNESDTTLKARILNGGTSDYLNWITNSPCNGARDSHNRITTANASICTSNWFAGIQGSSDATQCQGFADYMMFLLFHTTEKSYFDEKTTSDEIAGHVFKPGDLIRTADHSVVVASVEGDKLCYIECNANYDSFSVANNANCWIRKGRTEAICTARNKAVRILSPTSALRTTCKYSHEPGAKREDGEYVYKTVQQENGVWHAVCRQCRTPYYLNEKAPDLNEETPDVVGVYTVIDNRNDGVCSAPYMNASERTLKLGEEVEIIGSVVNAYNNTWLRTPDGKWIYSKKLEKKEELCPQNLKVESAVEDGTEATVSWDPVAWATSYQVQFCTSGNATWTDEWEECYPDKTATKYISTGLGERDWYKFRVRAVNQYGVSNWSVREYTRDHTHSYSSAVIAPTCTAQGYTVYTCSCGKQDTEKTTAALGHSWNDGNITTAAGCTTEGVKTYTCTRCSTTRTELMAAVGHSYQSVVTEPTYALGGYTTHTCTACGHSYRDGQTQPLKRTGTCGDGLTWELGGGTLTVSGGGDMYNYNNAAYCPPWYEYRTSIQTVVVESGVTSVGSFAFCGCSNLVSVQLADSVMQISNGAFSGCTGLKQVKLPNAVTQIESETFLGCENLESITIPESVTAIGEFAFGDCLALKSITIPRNVTSIGWRAFNNSGIETITFTGEAPTFDSNAFKDLTVVAFYSVKSSSWTSAVRQNYGGSITWEILDTTEFSDWSTSVPPADAAVVESKTVYRYRSKQWKTTTNQTLSAPWTQHGGDTVQYGPTWSLWSTNYAAKSAVLDVETKTQYHYFAFYSDSNRNPYTHATDLINPKFAEIWVDNELPFYKNYDNIDLWGDSTTNVTTDMNGVEKTHLISKWIKVRGTKAATGTKYAGQGAVDAGYMSESDCVYTRTVYRTRPITTTRQYWKWNDWSADTNPLNWVDSLPASYDEYESATLYRYSRRLFTVTEVEAEGGTITVDKIGGAADEIVTVTAMPAAGYVLKEILVDGQAIEGNTFAITGDHIVSAVFEPIIYTIGAEGAANGTVMVDKVSGTTGAIVTVTAVPAENYVLKEILVDGQAIEGNTFAVTGDHVVSAVFVQEVYTVTVGFIANGTVVADKASGHAGEVVTLEVASNPGCMLKRVLVDGVPIGGNRFTITGNHVVTAIFVEIPPVNVNYKTNVVKTIIVNGEPVEICRWNWILADK